MLNLSHSNGIFCITLIAATALLAGCSCPKQPVTSIETGNDLLDRAFSLAVKTIDDNTHDGIIEAGGGYGGEWTRDCSMNCWNCVSLLRPEVAEKSLWSVTENDGERIGHQYWDKILWALGAWNHYIVTGNRAFLDKAYPCVKTTMSELEDSCFDKKSGLFTGPAVYQDGIEAYPEPIYDPAKWDRSFVLDHNADSIKCLSTNCLYSESYRILAKMAEKLEPSLVQGYLDKADSLRSSIRETFYQKDEHQLGYVIDESGTMHNYQEGLGIAFAGMFGILDKEEAADVLSHAWISKHGITAIHPCFPRNSEEKPGRHNDMVWPHVNMYYADACADCGVLDRFWFELDNVADLAINEGEGDFYEIYTMDGIPSGGYQCGGLWDKKENQTWCATGYVRNILLHVFGMNFREDGIELEPLGVPGCETIRIKNLPYRNMLLDITVKGNGGKAFIPADRKGKVKITVE